MPWAQVKVPNTLQTQIFPFCEDVLARLRIGGCQNQGTINFLELLQHLRPFFWRVGHKKYHFYFFIHKIFSLRPLVPYRNTFLTQGSLSNSTFYLSLTLNYFSGNGLPYVGKKRPKTISCQSLGMHSMKAQLEKPSHLLQLRSME